MVHVSRTNRSIGIDICGLEISGSTINVESDVSGPEMSELVSSDDNHSRATSCSERHAIVFTVSTEEQAHIEQHHSYDDLFYARETLELVGDEESFGMPDMDPGVGFLEMFPEMHQKTADHKQFYE